MNEEDETSRIASIAVDWGTSNLRCWGLSHGGEVVVQAESGSGMATIAAKGEDGDFESALLDLIQPWLRPGKTVPVRACGMVGARQGWHEVPYDTAPCSPQTHLTMVPTRSQEIEVGIHAGVKQDLPADVMRGEETQIAGLLAAEPDFDGLVCLPGTHSKWARVAEGNIQSFRTFLTGELFALLAEQSVLRHTLAAEGWEEGAFLDGVNASLAQPAAMAAEVFGLRAAALLHGLDGTTARSRLSGLLIGQEFAGALAAHPPEIRICLIGSPSMARIYHAALTAAGRTARIHPSETCTLAGLTAGREPR